MTMLMTIFDKSFIHSINADEAAVFDMHFLTNITPLFFVEVLADLEKATQKSGREALVKSLAAKTPVWRSYPNMLHRDLVAGELMGNPIELRRVPVVGRGRRIAMLEGPGTIFDEPPEMKARRAGRGASSVPMNTRRRRCGAPHLPQPQVLRPPSYRALPTGSRWGSRGRSSPRRPRDHQGRVS
jgi:hypothetical protein